MFNSSDKKLCATKDKATHLGKMSQPLLTNDIDASTEDSISSVNVKEGDFIPVDPKWQRDKCKMLKLTFIIAINYEYQSTVKKLDWRLLMKKVFHQIGTASSAH